MGNPFVEQEGQYHIFRLPWTFSLRNVQDYEFKKVDGPGGPGYVRSISQKTIVLLYAAAHKALKKFDPFRDRDKFRGTPTLEDELDWGTFFPHQMAILGIQGGKGYFRIDSFGISLTGALTRIFLPLVAPQYSWIGHDLYETPEYILVGIAKYDSQMVRYFRNNRDISWMYSFTWTQHNDWRRIGFNHGVCFVDDSLEIIYNYVSDFIPSALANIIMTYDAPDQFWDTPMSQGRVVN